jgi:ankyrin repeat protein
MPDLEDREGEVRVCLTLALCVTDSFIYGQTSLHKASLNGHLAIVKFLISQAADVQARDADGWAPLHNACSKVGSQLFPERCVFTNQQGYLDIVRYLCEQGGAASEVSGGRGVDVRSKGGWTPLSMPSAFGDCIYLTEISIVNAASKGHLPVVLYLLTKQSADPMIRNNWGETAYDAAAAVFEVWICEVSAYRYITTPLLNVSIGSSESRG